MLAIRPLVRSQHKGCLRAELIFALLLLITNTSSLYAQVLGQLANPNPNNYDNAKIMSVIRSRQTGVLAAHRGTHALGGTAQAPKVPENSLQAIGMAAQAGWEAIEIDVKLTQDGTPILSHDSTWGREWCGRNFASARPFDPLDGKDSSLNPEVANTSLSNTRSFFGHTVLRDSVSAVDGTAYLGCSAGVSYFGEYPPTLQDVYDYIRNNHIQMVVELDIKDAPTSRVAWKVVQQNQDDRGRSAWDWTVFKVPAVAFQDTGTYLNTFGENYYKVKFNPVFHTAGIAATAFGSENAMIQWIDTFTSYNNPAPIDIVAIEVSMKEPGDTPNGGILETVRQSVVIRGITVSQFHSVPEYYVNNDPTQGQYFRSNNGICCYQPQEYLYNNKNNQGPFGNPYDHADDRGNMAFLVDDNSARMITTDRPDEFEAYLISRDLRNTDLFKADSNTPPIINSAPPAPITLVTPSSSAQAGTTVQLTATIYPSNAAGQLTLYDGSTIISTAGISTGSATFSVSSIDAGNHLYTAVYGDPSSTSTVSSNAVTVTASSSNTSSGNGGAAGEIAVSTPAGACSASFISGQWLLTAGHCFTGVANPVANTLVGGGSVDQVVVNSNIDAALVHLPYLNAANVTASRPYGIGQPLPGMSLRSTSGQWISSVAGPNYSVNSPGPQNAFLYNYSYFSQLGSGDAGGPITDLGLLCGIHLNGSSDPTLNYEVAVSTDYLAPWIAATTGIAADTSRTCGTPNQTPQTDIGLKVLPLGASITQGIHSSDNSGYRADLYVMLGAMTYATNVPPPPTSTTAKPIPALRPESALTSALDGTLTAGAAGLVGRKRNGGGADRYNEGYPGMRIDQVVRTAQCSIPFYHPNVVTLLVGTNDVQQSYDLAGAPDRLKGLIQQIINASPKATVLVSDIPPNTLASNPALEEETMNYNNAIPGVVQALQSQGLHVLFSPSMLTPDQVGPDNIHPTDLGYDQIAAGFLSGAQGAIERGWIQEPDADGELPAGCRGPDTAGGYLGSLAGTTDSNWQDTGAWFPAGLAAGNTYRFADVNGDNRSDLIAVNPDQSWTVYLNGGPTSANTWSNWQQGISHPARAAGLEGYNLRFADMDIDGRPDCVGVDLYGTLNVYVWSGQQMCATQVNNWSVHTTGTIPGSSFITLVDVDGDGAADYVITDEYGSARVWLRGHIDNQAGQSTWQAAKPATAAVTTTPSVFRWADLNGDSRADLIQVTAGGAAYAWLNQGVDSTVHLVSIGQIAESRKVPAADVNFADMDGDGKADYVVANSLTGLRVWLNKMF